MFKVKKYGVQLEEKNVDTLLQFITTNFGEIVDRLQLEALDFPFVVYLVKPHNFETPMLVTLGLHAIQSDKNPKEVFGAELFVRMPKDWEFTKELNYANGWINRVLQTIGENVREDNPLFPGSTYEFTHIANGSSQTGMVVNFSNIGDEFTVCQINKKQCVPFFELQTAFPEELTLIQNGNEEVLDKIFKLDYVDLNRGVVK